MQVFDLLTPGHREVNQGQIGFYIQILHKSCPRICYNINKFHFLKGLKFAGIELQITATTKAGGDSTYITTYI